MEGTAPPRSQDFNIRVTYRDTDQMGVVYYANYLVYMESGRAEYMRARGWTYRDMEKDGYVLPVLHAECTYKTPAHYDDLLRVRAILETVTRVQVVFRYEISREETGELLATGMTRHAFVGLDMKLKRATPEVVARLLGE
ncbi:MAG: acyl-CoA thioester hydrolase [Candidatus Sumerlaeota bacterium]|nr:acyl-CoA thioester hydrolase [Candidatus Sumerlaeota bacterium]